jgi:hypothetical protein
VHPQLRKRRQISYLCNIYLFAWYTDHNVVISRILFPFEKECRPTKERDAEVSVILGYQAASLSIRLRTFLGNAVFSSPRFETSKNRFGHFERTLPQHFQEHDSYTTKTET